MTQRAKPCLSGTVVLLAAACLAGADRVGAAEKAVEASAGAAYQTTVDRGVQFLVSQQAPDGSWSPQAGIGPTAMATMALLRNGRSPKDPQVAKSLAFLVEYTQESGGIHMPGGRIPNYETCICMVCLKEANRNGQYDAILKQAGDFLRKGQWTETRDKKKSDDFYGGLGYGGPTRPDLSNTAFAIEALRECGTGANDEAIQKALAFVSRCQNLESEHNTTQFAAKVNDGGFYYTCAVGRMSDDVSTPNGGLRSYGAMTYSGLKSMIYAGLSPDDPRYKAALQWIRKFYDTESNPGKGDAGLYYYYVTFAKTMSVLGADQFEDASGVRHDWRADLTTSLAKRQKPDGSWVNANIQWMEGDPNLSTAFALLALSYCRPTTETP